MNDLYHILFGPDWEPAARAADEQLRQWAAAFDAWLNEIEAASGPVRRKSCRFAWQDFWNTVQRLPWQVEPADVARWAADLEGRGRSPITIRERLIELEKFYKFHAAWTGKLGPSLDVPASPGEPAGEDLRAGTPASSPIFNPVQGVLPPRIDSSAHMEVMSREQVQALLAAVDREVSLVGKRDYALILAGLLTGVQAGQLRTLRWGDLPGFVDKASGTSGLETTAATAVHRAIEDYLRCSGRWETIAPVDYVFAPLSDPLTVPAGSDTDWNPHRPLSNVMLSHLLKRYACWAGLDGDRITWHVVRNTAALLRLEAGETLEGLQAFLGHAVRGFTEKYVKRLAGRQSMALWAPDICSRPHRSPKKRWQRRPRGLPGAQPGNTYGLKHGFSAMRPSLQEVLDSLDHNETGLEWETLKLRAIMRRAVELSKDNISLKDSLQVLEGFSLAAQRLSNLLRAGNDLKKTALEMGNWEVQDALNTALNDVIKEMGFD
jgi:integrase